MKQVKLLLVLLVLTLASFTFLTTLSKYSDEYAGLDSALIAKWNFGARGEDDPENEFFNKGFTFDLFEARSVKPMDHGCKYFTFTGGGSDVGIAYDVEMNLQDLLWLAGGTVAQRTDVDIYAPFIFRITAEIIGDNGDCVDTAPFVFSPSRYPKEQGYDSGWFRPGDIGGIDDDGFFSILDHSDGTPSFSAGSRDQVKITVCWQWNTSFFVDGTWFSLNETEASIAGTGLPKPDASEYGPSTGKTGLLYYQTAHDLYYAPGGPYEKRIAATQAVIVFLEEHGALLGAPPIDDGDNGGGNEGGEEMPDLQEEGEEQNGGDEGELPPEGQDQGDDPTGDDSPPGTFDYESFDYESFDYEEYNNLVQAEYEALEACNTSLMAAYDDYDTMAVNALIDKEAVKVIFRIKGNQMEIGEKLS